MNTALLLIAHGSRRPEANAELVSIAASLRSRGEWSTIQPSYLELAEPGIAAGGELCVASGAEKVVMLPYFLSPGRHVVEDLAAARDALQKRFPAVSFVLAEALGRHPLILDALTERAKST
ncbi:MAG: CbiX/SirB N-terminal domain-containing protein [Gemmataceae bacterium]